MECEYNYFHGGPIDTKSGFDDGIPRKPKATFKFCGYMHIFKNIVYYLVYLGTYLSLEIIICFWADDGR